MDKVVPKAYRLISRSIKYLGRRLYGAGKLTILEVSDLQQFLPRTADARTICQQK